MSLHSHGMLRSTGAQFPSWLHLPRVPAQGEFIPQGHWQCLETSLIATARHGERALELVCRGVG